MLSLKNYSFLFLSAIFLITGCKKDEDTIATKITANDFSATIQEKPAPGISIGKINASSNKSELYFAIKSQAIADAFSIDRSSGELFVANADVFVFSQNPILSAVVTLTSEDATKDIGITVTLSEEPIMIDAADLSLRIDEKRPTGTLLGSIGATTNRGTLS